MGQVRISTCPRTATDPMLDCRPVPDHPDMTVPASVPGRGAIRLSGLIVSIASRALHPLIRFPLFGHAIHQAAS
jgi:hypothetical protein